VYRVSAGEREGEREGEKEGEKEGVFVVALITLQVSRVNISQ